MRLKNFLGCAKHFLVALKHFLDAPEKLSWLHQRLLGCARLVLDAPEKLSWMRQTFLQRNYSSLGAIDERGMTNLYSRYLRRVNFDDVQVSQLGM
jgi:hypothetical protein